MFPISILIFATFAYRLASAFSGAQADRVNFPTLAVMVSCSAVFFINAHYQVAIFNTGTFSRYLSFQIILRLGPWIKKQQYKLLYLSNALLTLSEYKIKPDWLGSDIGCWVPRISANPAVPSQHSSQQLGVHQILCPTNCNVTGQSPAFTLN